MHFRHALQLTVLFFFLSAWHVAVCGKAVQDAPPVSSSTAAPWRTDVAGYARRMIHAGFFPGMQVAVTRGDKVVYVGSFGVADMDSGRRVDDRTRFYIASTTKAFTATAVVLEASRGRLQLDAPVTRYLPQLRFKPPLKAGDVTIRSLLRMTDGIDECLPVVFRTAFTGVFTQPQLVRLMRHCGLSDKGHAFVYRNVPYNLLGMVLAPDVGNGWKAVVRREVLKPLGMHETTARVSTLDPARIAMPHEATGKGFRRIRLAKADANLHAAGGYFTTARDLAKFVAVHASDGRLDGQRIFPADVVASMHAEHASQDRDFGPYHRFGWGYGWDLGTYHGRTIVHRFGSFAGYRSHASFEPGTGVGVVVLVNGVSVPYAADEMADYVYDRLDIGRSRTEARHAAAFRALVRRKACFARRMLKSEARRRARQRQSLPHSLTAYAGRYANPLLGTMDWTISKDHLVVSAGIARSDAEIYDAAKNQLRVELTGRGEVVRFRFYDGMFSDGMHRADALEYDGYLFRRVEDAGDSRKRAWYVHPDAGR